MRIGKQDNPISSICASDASSITVRNLDLCREVIGVMDFTAYFWLLVTGRRPSETQKFFADAVLTALAEHGLVPSVVAARMTLAAAPESFQGAVAAGLLGCGSVVLGSAEESGRLLDRCRRNAEIASVSIEEAARREVAALRGEGRPIYGLGHPQHAGGDPRADLLLSLADEHGVAAHHVEALHAIERAASDILGRTLPINVNGAIPAVLLDVGFPLAALKGIALLARTAGLVGHLQEESERPIGFMLSGKAAEAIRYEPARPSDTGVSGR